MDADIWYWQRQTKGSLPIEAEAINIMLGDTEVDARKATVHDIRIIEDEFKLAMNGLQFWNLPSEAEYTKDEDEIVSQQYPEVAAYLGEM